MNSMKILMIGPFPGPLTGHNILNENLYKNLKIRHQIKKIDTNTVSNFENLSNQGKLKFYKLYRSFCQVLKGLISLFLFKPDVLYITPGQSYYGFVKYGIFIKMAHMLKISSYIHLHGAYFRIMYESLNDGKKEKIKKILNNLTGAIVLGNSLSHMFDALLDKEKIHVCENGVEKELFLEENEIINKIEKYRHTKELNILFLSNLMKSKGILTFLEAINILEKEEFPIKVDIAGDIEPAIDEEIKIYLKKLKTIKFHGKVFGEKKRKLLQENYVFCLPTIHPFGEGQPLSILEAYATGNIVITTNLGGIPDIFQDKINGLYCDGYNPQDLALKMKEIRKNYEHILRKNYTVSIDKYTMEKFSRRIEDILIK